MRGGAGGHHSASAFHVCLRRVVKGGVGTVWRALRGRAKPHISWRLAAGGVCSLYGVCGGGLCGYRGV
jgi:hypothetical protein